MTKIMINKPLRAYNTRRQLVLLILPDGEVIRIFLFQRLKHEIHGIFEFLIIFSHFRSVDEFDQRGKILFFVRGLIVDVADERSIQSVSAFTQKSSPSLPSPLVLVISAVTSFKMSFSEWMYAKGL